MDQLGDLEQVSVLLTESVGVRGNDRATKVEP